MQIEEYILIRGVIMSASDECKAGVNDVIYFTEDCCVEVALDKDGRWDVESSKLFRIGDKVFFLIGLKRNMKLIQIP